MEDLVKCEGGDCLLRFHCLRFMKINPNKEEMFFETIPCTDDNKDCFYLWNQNAEDLFLGVERLVSPTN